MHIVADCYGNLFDVSNFDDFTDKKPPYYQNGKRYACCPECKSSVQIIGGVTNKSQSGNSREAYASHTRSKINNLPLKNYKKCPLYSGNDNNWQKIYSSTVDKDNVLLSKYIDDHLLDLAIKLTDLTGIRFWRGRKNIPQFYNNIFNNLVTSFKNNGGLKTSYFVPEAIPRLLLHFAKPISIWGVLILENDLKEKIEGCAAFKDCFDKKQFQPVYGTKFVASIDNINHPQYLNLKLIWGKNESILLKKISARYY